jgi:CubicO group peptidase (beta-lactamase class C family)
MSRRSFAILLASITIGSLALTGRQLSETPSVHPFPWPTSTPEEQGLDENALEAAFRDAGTRRYIYSLLVVKNGHLVAERYYNGQTMNDANHIHSCSKSFTSALVGIAFREGYLQDLDARMLDFFPEYVTPDLDPLKHEITIRHLLTMRAGFDFDENQQDWDRYWTSPNWVRYAIELPLRHPPGAEFHYSTPQTNLLSAILTKATSMTTRQFAERFLFEPLGITIGHWKRDPQGIYTGGHEMYFTPRDMARFGYLYLHGGTVNGQQIIPESWVTMSTHPHTSGWNDGPFKHGGYGFKWWIARMGNIPEFHAGGKGGQFIFVFPDLDMIVVTTTDGTPSFERCAEQKASVAQLVANQILPAAGDGNPPPPYPPSHLQVGRAENRALLETEYIDVLQWQPNPRNVGTEISAYRIYRFENGRRFLLEELASTTYEYWVRGTTDDVTRYYGVTSKAHDGIESVPVVVSIQASLATLGSTA